MMSNSRKILEETSATRRNALASRSALAVLMSLYFFGAGFFPSSQKSFASGLRSKPDPQRCGDHIFFSFNDETGKNIDPADFDSIMLVMNDFGPAYKLNVEWEGTKEFSLNTLCGYREMKVTIAYRNKKMELILKEIPGDQGDIFLYSIPFSEGAYTFDFERHLDKTCRDEVNGRRGQCIVSPKRLKKIAPESRKQGATKKHAG